MELSFYIKGILIFYIASIMTAYAHKCPEQSFSLSQKEKLMELVSKDLKNILQTSDCNSFPEYFEFTPFKIPKHVNLNQEKVLSFLSKPLTISNLGLEEINSMEIEITEIFKQLQKSKEDFIQRFPNQLFLRSNEYFLFERMCKVIKLIKYLSINTNDIMKMEFGISRDRLIIKSRFIHLKLYYALFHIRFTSFLDFLDSIEEFCSSSKKLELASNIYSVAILMLKKTKDILS